MESKNILSNIKCKSFKILNHINQNGTIIYIIEIHLSNNQSIKINQRYSELLNLHNLMSKEAKLPPFPPKKIFGNTDEVFLAQRQKDLNIYYNKITSSNDFVNLPSFTKWILNIINIAKIKIRDDLDFFVLDDIITEKSRQKKKAKEINEDILPLFIDMSKGWDQEMPTRKREMKYQNTINCELFPFVDNNPYSIDNGNDYNFNYIGSKNNNLVKIEKLFNNKLIDITKKMNEFVEKYKEPNLVMYFNI